jgi:hypothetical protein
MCLSRAVNLTKIVYYGKTWRPVGGLVQFRKKILFIPALFALMFACKDETPLTVEPITEQRMPHRLIRPHQQNDANAGILIRPNELQIKNMDEDEDASASEFWISQDFLSIGAGFSKSSLEFSIDPELGNRAFIRITVSAQGVHCDGIEDGELELEARSDLDDSFFAKSRLDLESRDPAARFNFEAPIGRIDFSLRSKLIEDPFFEGNAGCRLTGLRVIIKPEKHGELFVR